jgi:hypothetical protein
MGGLIRAFHNWHPTHRTAHLFESSPNLFCVKHLMITINFYEKYAIRLYEFDSKIVFHRSPFFLYPLVKHVPASASHKIFCNSFRIRTSASIHSKQFQLQPNPQLRKNPGGRGPIIVNQVTVNQTSGHQEARGRNLLMEFGEFGFGLLEDGDFGVGVFP